MGDRTAFFYGTLMAPPVLHRVIYGSTTPEPWQKSLTTVRPALLQNYRRHKVRNLDYPGILPVLDHKSTGNPTSPPPSVRGSLVTGLTDGDIWRLDIFEGDQYTRQTVRVKLLDASTGLHDAIDETDLERRVVGEVDAETYVWCADKTELEEEEWDFEEFKREKMWAWVGEGARMDEGFGDVDRAVEQERRKDGTGGRGVDGVIGKELERSAV